MINEKEMRIKGKLNYFLDEKIKVHVRRIDKQFWNGLIIEKQSDDVYIIKEEKLGLCHLFVCDVYEVEEYRGVTR